MAKYLGSHRHGVNTVAFWKEKTFKNSYHEGFESFVSCTNTDIAALSHILRDMKIAKMRWYSSMAAGTALTLLLHS